MTKDTKTPKDVIADAVERAIADAYAKGWAAASEAILGAATSAVKVIPPQSEAPAPQQPSFFSPLAVQHVLPEPRKTGRPATNTSQIVEDCITASPGMKGVKVVLAAQMIDPSINERTVRTALRRLKASKKIWQRNGLWYPKPKRAENENEGARNSPPH